MQPNYTTKQKGRIMSPRYLAHAFWVPAFAALLIIALAPPETALCMAPLGVACVAAVVRSARRRPTDTSVWTFALAAAALASIFLLEVTQ